MERRDEDAEGTEGADGGDGTDDAGASAADGPSDGSPADAAGAEGPESPAAERVGGRERLSERLPTAVGRARLWHLLAGIAVLALLARLVFLDARTAHWDEARVAHWIVHYNEFGHFAYRPIIHGPLIQQVNQVVFSLLGATDFAMRLPVAVVGGLLPLTAYLFRDHLDRDEAVAMGLFLAANSVLLYYSRFMRSDVLVAAFMFAGLGVLVRYYDTRRVRYLYAFGALAALGFASKENAVVYVLTWLGAGALLVDTGLYRPGTYATGWNRLTDSRLGRHGLLLAGCLVAGLGVGLAVLDSLLSSTALGLVAGLLLAVLAFGGIVAALEVRAGNERFALTRRYARYGAHTVGAGVLFVLLVVFLFAPRGDGLAGIYLGEVPPGQDTVALGIWEAVGRPAALPGFVVDVLTYAGNEFVSWFGRATEPGCGAENLIGGYACFLGKYLEVMLLNATALGIFAVVGFFYERYARPRSRNLVMFAGYVGGVSVLGYPLGTDIFGAWIVVHAVVPLSIPAGVGLARVYRSGRSALPDGDPVSALLFAGPAVVVAYGATQFLASRIPIPPSNSVLDLSLLQVVAVGVLLVSVGLAVRGGKFFADRDTVVTGAAAGLLLLTAMQVGAVGLGSVYEHPSERRNVLAQYAQPADDLDPMIENLERIAAEHEGGPDVVVYSPGTGEGGFVRRPEENAYPLFFRPLCTLWPETLPLNWYMVATDADVACRTGPEATIDPRPVSEVLSVGGDPPPMIVAKEGALDDLDPEFAAQYERSVYRIRKWGSEVAVYVHEDWTG